MRAQRSNPALMQAALDCFVATLLAMTACRRCETACFVCVRKRGAEGRNAPQRARTRGNAAKSGSPSSEETFRGVGSRSYRVEIVCEKFLFDRGENFARGRTRAGPLDQKISAMIRCRKILEIFQAGSVFALTNLFVRLYVVIPREGGESSTRRCRSDPNYRQ